MDSSLSLTTAAQSFDNLVVNFFNVDNIGYLPSFDCQFHPQLFLRLHNCSVLPGWCHNNSIGFKPTDCRGHTVSFNTCCYLYYFPFKKSLDSLDVCLGSLSCWNICKSRLISKHFQKALHYPLICLCNLLYLRLLVFAQDL